MATGESRNDSSSRFVPATRRPRHRGRLQPLGRRPLDANVFQQDWRFSTKVSRNTSPSCATIGIHASDAAQQRQGKGQVAEERRRTGAVRPEFMLDEPDSLARLPRHSSRSTR